MFLASPVKAVTTNGSNGVSVKTEEGGEDTAMTEDKGDEATGKGVKRKRYEVR